MTTQMIKKIRKGAKILGAEPPIPQKWLINKAQSDTVFFCYKNSVDLLFGIYIYQLLIDIIKWNKLSASISVNPESI